MAESADYDQDYSKCEECTREADEECTVCGAELCREHASLHAVATKHKRQAGTAFCIDLGGVLKREQDAR